MERDEARQRLLAARREAEAASRMLVESGLGMSLKESTQEDSTYDNEPADLGSETYEREKDAGLLEAREARMGEIDAATGRLEAGTYGRCEACGRAIGDERLRAVPWAARCLVCQEEAEAEVRNARAEPNTEVVPMPYGVRARPGSDDVGFDGEDAWQAVARYGTANSPQDVPSATDPTQAYVNADEDRDTVDPADNIVDPYADTPGQAFPSLRRRGDEPAYDPWDAEPPGRRDR
jgi:YteA family regulatory protein